MKIKVKLFIGEERCKEAVIEISDSKMEPLSAQEIEDAIEMNVREWANQLISIEWETEETS